MEQLLAKALYNSMIAWLNVRVNRVNEMFSYRFSMLFAARSPSRPKGNNVHVMNNLATTVISFICFISYVCTLTNTFNNYFLF